MSDTQMPVDGTPLVPPGQPSSDAPDVDLEAAAANAATRIQAKRRSVTARREVDEIKATKAMDAAILRLVRSDEAPFVRLRDKISFTGGVINVMVLTYLGGGYGWLLLWYYSLKFPVLMVARFVEYKPIKAHYYMLDFCYFANVLLLVYIWLLPDKQTLFFAVFAVTNGPLAWAVALFRNSLVFHSPDKITSAFIHLSPPICTFMMRWGADDQAPFKQQYLESYKHCTSDCWQSGAVGLWAGGLAVYCCWWVVYAICIKFFCPLPTDREYGTTYRLLTAKGFMEKLVAGNWKVGVVKYVLVNTSTTVLMMLPTLIWYHFYWAHFLFLSSVTIKCIWNGANWYIEVFSRKYKAAAPC